MRKKIASVQRNGRVHNILWDNLIAHVPGQFEVANSAEHPAIIDIWVDGEDQHCMLADSFVLGFMACLREVK